MIAKQTLFFTGDRKQVVPEGHPEAKFLFVREGSEIADAEVEKNNCAALVDSPAKKKQAEPQQQEPSNLSGDVTAPPAAAPADRKPAKKKGGRPAKKK